MAFTAAAFAENRCRELTNADRTRLAKYVQAKYKVAGEVRVESAEKRSCHAKLIFTGADVRRPFRVELFATPDSRYLTRELLDTTVDPIQEELAKAAAFRRDLFAGALPVQGSPSAPITLTVFSDFQCPFCAKLAHTLKHEVLPIEGKKVRLVFRHMPLPNHDWARVAAQATACAAKQRGDSFWHLHDYIFEHQSDFTRDNAQNKLTDQASRIRGLNMPLFRTCLADPASAPQIERDMKFAAENGINGTPTLFVNSTRVTNAGTLEQVLTLITEEERKDGSPKRD